ncbi:MAG TPA: hypothetical protein VH186_32115 [Chloroflexia bacterium]|nr:hypothetical protein [Chloroflexia bacterium]
MEEKEQKQEQQSQPGIDRQAYQQLVKRLKKIERRLRLQEAIRLLPLGFLAGGILGLLVAIVSRVTPTLTAEQVITIALVAVAVGVLGVLGYALFRPRPLLDTARRTDHALGLRERISTAIEGFNDPVRLGYATLGLQQFADAERSIVGVRANRALPLRVPRREGLLAVTIIPMLALALLLPNPFSDEVKANQTIKAQIEQQAQQIEELKQRITKENPEAAKNDPKTQELLKQLEQVKQDLLEKSDNKDDALAALQKAQQELEKLGDPNKTTAEKAAVESLAKTFNSTDATKPVGQALQQNSPDRYANAANELDKLANNLDQLKNDPSQAQQLSDKLSKDAQNFKNSNPQMADKLQKLSSAVSPNNLKQDPAGAQQAMKDVAQQLRQSGQNQQVNDQLQQAQSQLQKSEESINKTAQQAQANSQANRNKQAEANQDAGNNQQGQDQQGQDQQGQDQQGQDQQGQQGQQADSSGSQGQNQQGQQGQNQQGQQGQNQQGQQGQGQQPGQQQGQDQGQGQQGQQQGQGQQPGDQGQQGQGQGDQGDQPGQGSKAGKGHSDNVLPNPSMRRENGTNVNVQGKNGQGPTNNQTVNGGNPSGDASVPYNEVLDNYQQQAAQQLDKNYVPITLKDMVKQYFDDLNNKNK